MNKRRMWVAVGTFLSTLVAGLLVYQQVPTLDQAWQPFLQAILTTLGTLGFAAVPVGRR